MTAHTQRGLSLVELLVAMLLVTVVALVIGGLTKALGVLGITQFAPGRYERPARARTLAIEYAQAEMEYLRGLPYHRLRNAATCTVPGAPSPLPAARRITPAGGGEPGEPPLPALFAAADIVVQDYEAASSCGVRRITIYVYRNLGDAPASPGEPPGAFFLRADVARSPE
jgi:prepilin-type N-terminal cleavage/methylation domain-containing protein